MGKWQQKDQGEQKHFTPEQKRLVLSICIFVISILDFTNYNMISTFRFLSMRDAIKSCPMNWENCTMCVQDLISLSTNITAEMTKHEVDNFVRMCKIFSERSNISENISASINCDQVTIAIDLIEKEISESRVAAMLETRKRFELEIISILRKYVHQYDSSLELHPFGSSQYGVKIANTDFNLAVTTSKCDFNFYLDVKSYLPNFFFENRRSKA